jgi:hypothetical protein
MDDIRRGPAKRLAVLDTDVLARYTRVLNEIGLARFGHAIERETAYQREIADELVFSRYRRREANLMTRLVDAIALPALDPT